jgi:hypothetical protein
MRGSCKATKVSWRYVHFIHYGKGRGYHGWWPGLYQDVHIPVKQPGDHVDEHNYTLFVMRHVWRDHVWGPEVLWRCKLHNYYLLIMEHVLGIA